MNKRLMAIVIVLLSLIVVSLAGYIILDQGIVSIAGLFSGKDGEALSEDQRKVIKKMGYPDVFVVMMENDDRREIWTYFSKEINCVFINGKLSSLKEQKPLNQNFHYTKIRPAQFFNGMMEEDVIKILSNPTAITEGTIETVEGKVKIFDYFDQVRVGMVDGQVVYVQTLPFALR